jgi:hypothetical protein
MTITEYTNYANYKHLYINTNHNGDFAEYGSNTYGNKDPKKLFRLIPHYNGDFGYSVGSDSLKIMHINKEKLSTFIYCLKNKINTNIVLIVDAITPAIYGSHKQYAICCWKYENDYLFFTDYEDDQYIFSGVKVKLNDSIINNMEIIYDYHNDDLGKAFAIMDANIETFNDKLIKNEEKMHSNNIVTGFFRMLTP